MKKKIGEIYDKPIVIGDKNLVTENEIHVDELCGAQGGGAQGGGETGKLERNDVNFFDYDGTLLYAYSWEQAKNLKALPTLPTHEGLEVREWNYTLEDIKAQGTETTIGKADIGACCYDGDGELVMVNDVLIIPRGEEELPHNVDNMAIGVLSIPNTVIYGGSPSFYRCFFAREVKLPISLVAQNMDNYSFIDFFVAPSIYVNGIIDSYNGYIYRYYPVSKNEQQETMVNFTSIGQSLRGNYFKFPYNTEYINEIRYNVAECVAILDFSECLYVPTLYYSTSSFNNAVFIIVPDELYDEWVISTNWSYVSKDIYPASQYKNVLLK